MSGTINRSIGQMQVLNVLMLQHNQLNGTIHDNLWTLRRINHLDLHDNQLSGTISSAIGWVLCSCQQACLSLHQQHMALLQKPTNQPA